MKLLEELLDSEDPRLEAICSFVSGSAFPEKFQGKKSGDFPFIKVSDMKTDLNKFSILDANNWINQNEVEKLNAKLIPPGSVVFAKIGLGLYNNRMRLTTMPTLIDNNMMAAIPKNGISSEILYTILNTIDMQDWAIGAALPYIRASDLGKIKLNHFNWDELSLRSEIEIKINLNITKLTEISNVLHSLLSEVYRSWFIDFDPIRAREVGNLPYGFNEEQAQAFPKSFKDSESGKIPEGWIHVRLSDLAKRTKETVNPRHSPDVEFLHYSIPSFDAGQLPSLTIGKDIQSNKFIVPENSVLLSKLNPRWNRVWIPEYSKGNVSICSTELLPWVPKNGVSIFYLYSLMVSEPFRWLMDSRISGTTGSHQRVRPEECENIPCLLPNPEVMTIFHELGENIFSEINNIKRKKVALISIKEYLLPRIS